MDDKKKRVLSCDEEYVARRSSVTLLHAVVAVLMPHGSKPGRRVGSPLMLVTQKFHIRATHKLLT